MGLLSAAVSLHLLHLYPVIPRGETWRRTAVVVYWVVKKSNGKTQHIVPESSLQVW